jgi:hypothetical protein
MSINPSDMPYPLAAYGPLMPGCGGVEHLGIEELVRPLEPCLLPGEIWLINDQRQEQSLSPALLPGPGYSHGFLLEVDPRAWPAIDRWEIGFQRRLIELQDGVTAWAYHYVGAEPLVPLRERSWARYAAHPKAIPIFPAPEEIIPPRDHQPQ